ncbi:MAG: hypothetical protein IJP70_02280 [Bacteroidales bacterium]|nr:hypothetical protein [Bacteroidales bacterium]
MKWLMFLLSVFLTALLSCAGTMMEPEVLTPVGNVAVCEETFASDEEQSGRRNEALLADAHDISHICNTRPQRLSPTFSSRSGKRVDGQFVAARQQHVKPLNLLHDGRRRQETAPFHVVASCDYYVFVLRRILC